MGGMLTVGVICNKSPLPKLGLPMRSRTPLGGRIILHNTKELITFNRTPVACGLAIKSFKEGPKRVHEFKLHVKALSARHGVSETFQFQGVLRDLVYFRGAYDKPDPLDSAPGGSPPHFCSSCSNVRDLRWGMITPGVRLFGMVLHFLAGSMIALA